MGGKICRDEEGYNTEISRRIERLRLERRMQRIELARAAGVSGSKFYGYECGKSRWPAFRLRLIADYFRVPLEEIVPKKKHIVNSPPVQQKLL